MRKIHIRIITAILAAVLLFSMLSGVFMMARADAASPGSTEGDILTADTKVSTTMTYGKAAAGITITFYFWQQSLTEDVYDFKVLSIPASSSFSWGKETKLKVTYDKNKGCYKGELSRVTYNGGSSTVLQLFVGTDDDQVYFEIPISSKYFRTSSEEDEELPVSDIVPQSVRIRNSSGQTLDTVTKDTDPFTVEITFYDVGLKDEAKAALTEGKIYAFITPSAGFRTLGGTGGTVEFLSVSGGYPRFRAVFNNIKSDGTANLLYFRILYDLPGYEKSIKGERPAELPQLDISEEDEEDIPPFKPNIIVQSYSYGSETIVAGDEFNLDMEFTNTSKTVGVENVVLTIEPGNGFVIAASSNTVYVQSLSPGEKKPYSVALRAAAAGNTAAAGVAGAQTDYSVTVRFEYQYFSQKKPTDGKSEVKIAIPVVQLDRFSVDEITDYTQHLPANEEGYVTVPFTNEGKSPIYNISAEIICDGNADFTAPAARYSGNLEASKSGSIDLSIVVRTPGEFIGEVIVYYEDEYMNRKQISVPFSIMVTEPYTPQPENRENPVEKPTGMHPIRIFFCGLGSLMVAVPLALCLMKRVRARGKEDMDEGF